MSIILYLLESVLDVSIIIIYNNLINFLVAPIFTVFTFPDCDPLELVIVIDVSMGGIIYYVQKIF